MAWVVVCVGPSLGAAGTIEAFRPLAKVWRTAILRSTGEFMQPQDVPVKFAWQRTWSSREGCISLARARPCFTSPQSASIIIAPLDHRTGAWR